MVTFSLVMFGIGTDDASIYTLAMQSGDTAHRFGNCYQL